MRFVVIGAGAVGAVLGVSLEHGKHDVMYLLRKGRKRELRDLQLVDGRGRVRRRDAPIAAEHGARIPPFEWAIVAVRGDQLAAAIETLGGHVRPDAKVVMATGQLDQLERVRAAHPGGPVVALAPAFLAWSEEPRVYRWFSPPLLKSLVSGEGDLKADEAARELATALEAVGVPAQAVASASRSALPILAAGSALLAGWELAKWDSSQLARDGALRSLTAGAIHEAAKAVRQQVSGPLALALSLAPAPGLSLLLRALPQLDRGNVAAMWSHHGPKIAAQTRAALDDVIARAQAQGGASTQLRELRSRLPALA